MELVSVVMMIQLFFGIVIGLYFWNLLKSQRATKHGVEKESKKELEKLHVMKRIQLTMPLSEKIRPKTLSDVIGQQAGIEALRAALCNSNPQHVLIYGPPGIGKTAAARLVLEEAKKSKDSPFSRIAPFIELDATTARFDERGIADPLIGSVHDPIYQGAGAMGQAGIPQPKKGAVSNAHGGILFIDEIGELHPTQMNKLLKVLEDRKVLFESAYYSEENEQIPRHIHQIFSEGLPADFRLIGATTRRPEEIAPAIRSRCLEIYFKALDQNDMKLIGTRAAEKIGSNLSTKALDLLTTYANNGREAVNIIQIASTVAKNQKRKEINEADVNWVADVSQLIPKMTQRILPKNQIGRINGLGVSGPNTGHLLPIEVLILPATNNGNVTITGIAEEETLGTQAKSIKRKSMARASVETVVTYLKSIGVPAHQYDIHVNFPGGTPVDGPSAGLAMTLAIYSSIKKTPINHKVAVTGELSLYGEVRPVGGVPVKVRAAEQAGAKIILVPKENMDALSERFTGIKIIPVTTFKEALNYVLQPVMLEDEQYIEKRLS
ncbi:Lon protease 2 [Paraliobacillus sp. PM-2]|uniref:ATP-dependent protease LonB n=1 Tax=Paraliobacillus sp. PM-2 TaxID=1462524 RepID=UPI00061BB1D1|nr:ATP-dependent protease LonB [Paraliobacillus sp. PM-2]CQR48051.1 Lon protease 2 [Paraliobacillus sp. PM-2]